MTSCQAASSDTATGELDYLRSVYDAALAWARHVAPSRDRPGWANAGPADQLYRLIMEET